MNELGLYTIDSGAASLTIIVTVAIAPPPVLLAETVYVLCGEIPVGVPEIEPVEVSNTYPLGNAGVIDHISTAPPWVVGITGVIKVSLFNSRKLGL